jgi:hypothetical protein
MENLYQLKMPDGICNDAYFRSAVDSLLATSKLEKGWTPSGEKVEEAAIRRASDMLIVLWRENVDPEYLTCPHIYPTPEGGIKLYWVRIETNIVVNIARSGEAELWLYGGDFFPNSSERRPEIIENIDTATVVAHVKDWAHQNWNALFESY